MLIVRFILAFGLALGLGSASAAAPITWAFEGTVRILEGDASELGGSLDVHLGTPVYGHVTYDGSAVNFGGPDHGVYDGALLGFGVAIGSFESQVEAEGCCFFDVSFSDPVTGRGSYSMFGLSVAGSLFPTGAHAGLSLISDTPGVIPPSQSLPLAPPPLSALRPFSIADWGDFGSVGTGLQLGFSDLEAGWVVVELTSLAVVPEPEVSAFLALASLMLVMCRKFAP